MSGNLEIINRRAPQPTLWDSESFVHWLFFTMAMVVIGMSFLMSSDGNSRVFLPGFESAIPSMCSTKVLLGIDCPGCGLTRAFISISHGDFVKAWGFNRSSFVVYAFVAVQIPWHAVQLWRRKRGLRPMESNLVYIIPIGMVLTLFVNWVVKLVMMSV